MSECTELATFAGIEKGDYWAVNPEYVAYTEKECGKIPENESFFTYYYARFSKFTDTS